MTSENSNKFVRVFTRGAAAAVLLAAVICLAVRLLIFAVGPLASLADPLIGEVFSQWKSADVSLILLMPMLFAAAAVLLFMKAKRHRLLAALGCVIIVIAGVLVTLVTARINSVPLYTLIRIIMDFVSSGALKVL